MSQMPPVRVTRKRWVEEEVLYCPECGTQGLWVSPTVRYSPEECRFLYGATYSCGHLSLDVPFPEPCKWQYFEEYPPGKNEIP